MHVSPLLNYAIRIRERNVELRRQIASLQNDIQVIEKDISRLSHTYDDLVEQCRILREKQTDRQKDTLLEEYQKQFNEYVYDVENYLNNKEWNLSSIDKTAILCKKKEKYHEKD